MNTIIDTISRRIEGNVGTGTSGWTRLLLAAGGIGLAFLFLRGLGRAFWTVVGFGWMFFWISRFGF